jgi:hypothetical protein
MYSFDNSSWTKNYSTTFLNYHRKRQIQHENLCPGNDQQLQSQKWKYWLTKFVATFSTRRFQDPPSLGCLWWNKCSDPIRYLLIILTKTKWCDKSHHIIFRCLFYEWWNCFKIKSILMLLKWQRWILSRTVSSLVMTTQSFGPRQIFQILNPIHDH